MVRKTGTGRCACKNECVELVQLFFKNISFVSFSLFLGFRFADDEGAEGTGFDRCGI